MKLALALLGEGPGSTQSIPSATIAATSALGAGFRPARLQPGIMTSASTIGSVVAAAENDQLAGRYNNKRGAPSLFRLCASRAPM